MLPFIGSTDEVPREQQDREMQFMSKSFGQRSSTNLPFDTSTNHDKVASRQHLNKCLAGRCSNDRSQQKSCSGSFSGRHKFSRNTSTTPNGYDTRVDNG